MKQIAGNTYPVRERLKQMGGRWDPALKSWFVPDEREAEAKELVEAQDRERSSGWGGELWQPCFCGTEPVCLNCERCERHCHC